MSNSHSIEIWKPVDDHCGSYEVSNLGNVRSVDRLITRKSNIARIKGKVLSPNIGKSGYLSVQLSDIVSTRVYVHRLVAKAFIRQIDGCTEVNHKNGIKSDNKIDNLEWVTRSQNVKHSFEVLNRAAPWNGKFGKLNPNSKAVVGVSLTTGESISFGSCGEAGRNGFDYSMVSKCCRGKVKSHKSFVFSWCATNGVELRDAAQWAVDPETGECL